MTAAVKSQAIDFNLLATAMATTMATAMGTALAPLVEALRQDQSYRHKLRNDIQGCVDKNAELDTEVRLLKGVQVQLMGDGSGTSGMLPALQREGTKTQNDVSELRSDMRLVKDTLERMERSMGQLQAGQVKSKTFMDGWRGLGVAIGIIGTCVTIIGGIVAAVVWLYTHGAVK